MRRDSTEMLDWLLLSLAKGNEQCETAWTHIRGCVRCKKIQVAYALAAAVGGSLIRGVPPESEDVDDLRSILRELVGSEAEVAELLRSIFSGREVNDGD